MTATQLGARVGQLVYLQASGLEVLCKVVDAKRSYGQERVRIEPMEGKGQAWVATTSVRPCEGGA